LLAIEVREAELDDLLAWLAVFPSKFPWARCVALAQGVNQQRDEMLREAGVIHIVSATRKIATLLELLGRHVERVPHPSLGLLEEIEASLPWNQS
jgi:hypothetical protein